MLIYSIRAFGLYKRGSRIIHFMFMAMFPIGNVALYGSIYITLAVSIERFLGKILFRPIPPPRPHLYVLEYM